MPNSQISPTISPTSDNRPRRGRNLGRACLALLKTTSLLTEADVANSVSKLDHYLADLIPEDVDEFVSTLESVPQLLEFVISVASEHGFQVFSTALLAEPPRTAEDFPSSHVSKLLTRFSTSLSMPYARVSDAPPVVTAHRRSVDLASSALSALVQLNASGALSDDLHDVPETRRVAKNREKMEKRRRRSTVSGRALMGSAKPIIDYGEQVPTSKLQAAELATRIIGHQMNILQEYLDAFRQEETSSFFYKVYLPSVIRNDDHSLDTLAAERQGTPAHATPPSHGTEGSQGVFDQTKTSGTHLDNAEGFGAWRISISTRADRDLRHWHNRDAKTFNIIVDKIKGLSTGYFTKNNQRMLSGGNPVDVPIYEARLVNDLRLLYHIHCDLDFESKVERQVIRIFGIYAHSQVDQRFWDIMSRQLGSRGPEYRKRCIYRRWKTIRDLAVLPGEFSPMPDAELAHATSSPSPEVTTRGDMEQLHSLLALEKFVAFSQEFLNNILADQEVAHVFDLSPREQEIMAHTSSCFVLGRSGTGKTTTMIFKMLANERTWVDLYQGTMGKPRQLFMTQSHVLAQKVEEYFARLMQGFATENLSMSELKKMATASPLKRQAARMRMVNADEVARWNATGPTRYGDLKDSDFPMFLTFDRLCRLLEGEFRHLIDTERISSAHAAALRDILQYPSRSAATYRQHIIEDSRRTFVDFDVFRLVYWSQFPLHVKNTLSPELVFGEFLGVIKGSEVTLKAENQKGYLTKDDYCHNISRRTQATSPALRETIYDLFLTYTRMKMENRQYDAADRTRMLIKSMEIAGVPGRALSFVYVDEVQDNLLIDALVIKKLCTNPHGFFWAGDTAQTISAGSAFQFNELKAFMHRVSGDASGDLVAKREHNETFNLTVNYRSHSGIVKCAYSLVQIITKYWPDTIDRLAEERAMTIGPKPLFFSDSDGPELHHALFRASDGGCIVFGTRQCIIVRSDAARKSLRKEMGDIGQIFTVYESKGLEFDDVLLYNPFEDSTVDYPQWRVILNELGNYSAPTFKDSKHAGICRELKHLYVAITRARMNLWILDCSQNAEPLQLFWTTNGLIDVHPPGSPVPRLAVESSKEEWADASRMLFSKGHYSEAMLGFKRAGLKYEYQVAFAYSLREEALSAPADSKAAGAVSQAALFVQAAESFMTVAQGAADDDDKQEYYRVAAGCFESSGNDRSAGFAYHAACQYTLAAQSFRKAGSFDEAVEVIKNHRDQVDEDIARRIIDVSRLHYIKEDNIESARALFKDDNAALEYMKDYGLDSSRASLLERCKRYEEAADCCIVEGKRLEAIRLFLRDGSEVAIRKAMGSVFGGLWEYLSLGAPEANWYNPMVETLLGYGERIGSRIHDNDMQNELAMFRARFEKDLPTLDRLSHIFRTQENLSASLLTLDQLFSHDFNLQSADITEVASCLRSFWDYARSLQRFTCHPSPCNDTVLQKLFAFESVSEEIYRVSQYGHLFSLCSAKNVPDIKRTEGERLLVPRWILEDAIKTTLVERLHERVINQNQRCRDLRSLQPCLLYAVHQYCPECECPQLHVTDDLSAVYNTLVRIHIILILIFHTMYVTEIPYHILIPEQRYWLGRLYDAIYPPHFSLGSLHVLNQSLIPELQQGRSIVSVWLQDSLNRLHPEEPACAFLSFLGRATRLAMLFDQSTASSTLQCIPCASNPRFPRPKRLFAGPRRYIVHDLLAMMQSNHPDALYRGITFLNHVLYNRLEIDINVLCDYMDHLCGALLFATYLKRWNSLHGLTLPKSWIVRQARDAHQVASMHVKSLEKYTAFASLLVQRLRTGDNAKHLLFESGELSSRGLVITRLVYFARVCKNLCLWAYNNHSEQVKQDVTRIIAGRVGLSHRDLTDPIVAQYVNARDWNSLSRTMLHSTGGSTLDEMVQLHHRSRLVSGGPPPNTRRVIYSKTEELPDLLDAKPVVFFHSEVKSQLEASTDRILQASCSISSARTSTSTPSTTSRSLRDDSAYELSIRDMTHKFLTSSVTATSIDDNAFEATQEPDFIPEDPEEALAASKIASAYRKYALRKLAEKDTVTEMRRRVLARFGVTSKTIPWKNPTYRLLFRRAAPHLLHAAECLRDHLQGEIHIAKANLRNMQRSNHQELDNIQAAFHDVSSMHKEACRLREALLPTGICTVHGMERLQIDGSAVQELLHLVESQRGEQFYWRERIALALDLVDRAIRLRSPSLVVVETNAVAKIVHAYRRWRSHQKSLTDRTFNGAKYRAFVSFLEESKRMPWMHSHYKHLYLGPVPVLFATVEAMKTYLQDAKDVLKKRYKRVDTVALEDAASSLTNTIRHSKDATRLRQAFAPSSAIHGTEDLSRLQACARNFETLMNSLPATLVSSCREEVDFALGVIILDGGAR